MIGEMLPVTTPEEAASYRKSGLWRDETLFGRFEAAARAHPNKVAIRLKDKQLTYSEFRARVVKLANGFRRAGILKGEIVALQAPTCVEQPLVHLALSAIGAVYLPLQNSFQETEIAHLIDRSRAVAAIFSDLSREIVSTAPPVDLRREFLGARGRRGDRIGAYARGNAAAG